MNAPRRLAVIFLFAVSLCSTQPVKARWFFLPGVYYTQDLNWVFTASAVYENSLHDRYTADFGYYQNAVGQVKLVGFFTRAHRDLTFMAEYFSHDYPGYSYSNPSDQTELIQARRRKWEFRARCDFPSNSGFFYGYQLDMQSFEFLVEGSPLPTVSSLYSSTNSFVDGEEYSGSLRVGLEKRNNRYHTTSGVYLLWQFDLGRFYTEGEPDALVRLQLDSRFYHPIRWSKSMLAFNLRAGVQHSHVPFFGQFTLGGQFDLRGFPNDRYSGNAYYLGRAEWRQTVIDSLNISMKIARHVFPKIQDFDVSAGFVIFTDGGDLWRADSRWWGFRQSFGAGLRLILPPSVVASLDVARPVAGGDLALYLSLEQSF
jgi:outer membrane protein assembly factor BamA